MAKKVFKKRKKPSVFDKQKQLARPRKLHEPPRWDVETRKEWRRLKLIPKLSKACDDCGAKDVRLTGDFVDQEELLPTRKWRCDDCWTARTLEVIEESRKERKHREKAFPFLFNKRKDGSGKQQRPSLSPEGNVPLMIRLIKEGKSKKEIRREFRKLYHALGRKDEAFIRSRVRLYRGRALKRMNQAPKKGVKKK